MTTLRGAGKRRGRGQFDCCFGHDSKLSVAGRDIEMMHDVANMVAIGMDARARTRRQFKLQAPLTAVAARLHSQLHGALIYR